MNLSHNAITEQVQGGVTLQVGETFFACNSDGLFLESETEGDLHLSTGLREWGEGTKKRPEYMYLHTTGVEEASVEVSVVSGEAFEYHTRASESGVCRALLGRGIRDNYLSFDVRVRGVPGATVDAIDLRTVASKRTL